jgi:hypothetical protein
MTIPPYECKTQGTRLLQLKTYASEIKHNSGQIKYSYRKHAIRILGRAFAETSVRFFDIGDGVLRGFVQELPYTRGVDLNHSKLNTEEGDEIHLSEALELYLDAEAPVMTPSRAVRFTEMVVGP